MELQSQSMIKFVHRVTGSSYNSNPNLKPVGVAYPYTQEEVEEYVKCQEDPIYFIENYVKVVHPDRGLVKLKLFDYQREMVLSFWKRKQTICLTARQMGKALCLDTDIPTPSGFIKMRDLKVGDQVFDRRGQPCTVTFKSQIHHKPTYRLTLSDGNTIDACEDHIWSLYDYKKNRNNRDVIVETTTKEIFDSGILLSPKQKDRRYHIPVTDPVNYAKSEVSVDPYTLGYWLGDGSCNTSNITIHDNDVDSFVSNCPTDVRIKKYPSAPNNINTVVVPGLITKLKSYGVSSVKQVPDQYLTNDIDTRLEVLRGLMDSDGTVHTTGNTLCISFSNKYPKLIETTQQLLESLGIKVSVYDAKRTNSTTLRFVTELDVFKLARKATKHVKPKLRKHKKRAIVGIERIDTKPTQCITVDSDDHTFLCTKHFIPTHNSTIMAAFFCWYTLFNDEMVCAILANKAIVAREILSRYQKAYENLPEFLQQGVITFNKGSVELENGSKLIAASTSSSAIRGFTINCLYLDEFAFVNTAVAEEFFTSVWPTLSSGKKSKMIITSTPNGFNHFYKLWDEAEKDINGFNPIFVHWSQHPDRDDNWKKEQLKVLGEDKFAQEMDAEFLGSSNTLIPSKYIKTMSSVKPLHSTQGIKIFKEPIKRNPIYQDSKDHTYVIVCDPSRGTGNDNTAFIVYDVSDYPVRISATFRDNTIDPLILPTVLERVARTYNDAHVLIEINDNGQQVTDILWRDLEYENVVVFGGFSKKAQYGARTDTKKKRQGCSLFKGMIESQKLIINDVDLIQEISNFVKKRNSYEAASGHYDDLVMCCVLFAWFATTEEFQNLTDTNYKKEILKQNMQHIEEDILPFGFIDNGHDIETTDKVFWETVDL